MNTREAQDLAARLGLSAWTVQVIAVGKEGREEISERKCVGFASADFVLTEADSWDEAFAAVERIVFGA